MKIAYPYRDELNKKMCEIAFNPKYMFYNFGTYWSYDYKIADTSWELLQFVSVDGSNNVIGYLSANVHRDHDKIDSLGIVNFTDINSTFANDLKEFLLSLFDKFNYRKIEFSVAIGNPIEHSYDKIISRYGGRVVGIKERSVKLMDNNYYGEKMYEIFKNEYEKKKGRRGHDKAYI